MSIKKKHGGYNIKILMLDAVGRPNNTGLIHRFELIKEMSKLGLDVFAITKDDIELNGVYTYLLTDETKKNIIYRLKYKVKYLLKIMEICTENEIDILYTRNGLIALMGILLKKAKNAKLVYEVNGIASDELNLNENNTGKHKYKKVKVFLLSHVGFIVAKKADALIVVTSGIKKYLIDHEIDKHKIFVVNNGVNINLFKPVDNISSLNVLKSQYDITSKSNIVAFIGSMNPWQGVEYLISAAPLVLKECPDTQFMIVGDKGPMLNQWRNLVKNNGLDNSFIFTGGVPYEEVPLYINISDICVVPKRELKSGYSPLKLYEYMACAKPIIATNTAGFEILEQYNSGILVNPKSSQEFANAIITLLKDNKLQKQMGDNGRRLVIERYSWEASVKKIISIFKEIKCM